MDSKTISNSNLTNSSIIAVTVTYGDRWRLLELSLTHARNEGVASAIVVTNGSKENISALVSDKFGDWAEVINLEKNYGTAKAFAAGIERAISKDGGDYVLLIDDDNLLTQGAVALLLDELITLQQSNPISAVFCNRSNHGSVELDMIRSGRCRYLINSFVGFHIGNILGRVLKISNASAAPTENIQRPNTIDMPAGPYGGLLFSNTLIKEIGLPDSRFVVYQDDTEFTSRITRLGGKLRLVGDAIIEDAEKSWNDSPQSESSIKSFLNSASAFRVFYTFRNKIYLDVRRRRGVVVFYINLCTYMCVMGAMSILSGRLARFEMLFGAMRDGLTGCLGEAAQFPLP